MQQRSRPVLPRAYRDHLAAILRDAGQGGLSLYMALELHANSDGECRPGLRRLASHLHTGQHQVLQHVAQLERFGYVQVQRRPGRLGNLYRLQNWAENNAAAPAALAPAINGAGAAALPGFNAAWVAAERTTTVTPSNGGKAKRERKSISHEDQLTPEQAEVFRYMYQQWPRHVGRDDAAKEFALALKRTGGDLGPIARGYSRHLPQLQRKAEEDGTTKYIVHLRTWFSQSRWRDEEI